jgi:hypothetical protein
MDQLAQLEAEAHEIDRADRNAQRYYRAARDVDLRRWLLRSARDDQPAELGLWTIERRTRLMRRELASRDAELCRRDDHFDAFGDPPATDIAAHVAAHLAELSS